MLKTYLSAFLLLISVNIFSALKWPQRPNDSFPNQPHAGDYIFDLTRGHQDKLAMENYTPIVDSQDKNNRGVSSFLQEYKSSQQSPEPSTEDNKAGQQSCELSRRSSFVEDKKNNGCVNDFLREYQSRPESPESSLQWSCDCFDYTRDILPLNSLESLVGCPELRSFESYCAHQQLIIAGETKTEDNDVYPKFFCCICAIRLAKSLARQICWDGYSEDNQGLTQEAIDQETSDVRKYWENFSCNLTNDDRTLAIEKAILKDDEKRFYRVCCEAKCQTIVINNVVGNMLEELQKRYPQMYPGHQKR